MTLEIKWKPSQKQIQAFNHLTDTETTELLYGGGAGGGKSHLGCVWAVYMCLAYPGVRGLMGRAVLKTLKESTLLTFFRVCRQFGLKKDIDYKYNYIEGKITFIKTESEIYLKDLKQYPADPEVDELGSTEYTFAYIDEASQVSHKAYQIVQSRSRYRLDEYGLVPKILTATNPTKNFLYAEFYKPFKDNNLQPYRKFIQALVGDNPYISRHYVSNLYKLDKNSRERLLFGNWEYDDDPSRLFEYEQILDIFTNNKTHGDDVDKFISADIARFGSDKTVIVQWILFHIARIYILEKSSTKEVRELIQKIADLNKIPRSHIVVDEDGIGGGVVDEMQGIKGFVNNSRPRERPLKVLQLTKHNYSNLKAQCYFLLADYVRESKISSYKEITPQTKSYLIEELEQIKRKDYEKESKIAVTPKEEIIELLGRSPDFADAMMMRMLFELIPQMGRISVAGGGRWL